jgi:hypothetical protein
VPSYECLCVSLVPLGAGGLVKYIRGNVLDLIVVQAASEGRHRVLAVGDLHHNRGLLQAAVKVRLEGFLSQGLLVLDHVVAAGVARSAVAGEHLGAGLEVGSVNSGGEGHGAGEEGGSDLVVHAHLNSRLVDHARRGAEGRGNSLKGGVMQGRRKGW